MALPPEVFCDTSFFYACFDPHDVNHRRAQAVTAKAASSGAILCTTWDIISETVTVLRYRQHYRSALIFLNDIKPGLRIISYGSRVREEAEHVFRQYGRDHRLSFCDAISFVIVTTLLDHMPCFPFDEDFRGLGLTVLS